MELIEKHKITPELMGLFDLLKMNSRNPSDYVLEMVKTYFFEFTIIDTDITYAQFFEKKDWCTYIKSGKKEPFYRMRLSKLGDEIWKSMHEPSNVLHPLAEFTLEFCKSEYNRVGANNMIKSGDKLLKSISSFLLFKETYNKKMIKAVIRTYVDKRAEDITYINNMGTLFFKPSNVYTSKWSSSDSPICDFIEINKQDIKQTYNKLR